MALVNNSFRAIKPRLNGVTMVLEKGLGLHGIEDMLEVAGPYIDYVKLGWGTSFIHNNIRVKLDLYSKYDMPVCLGGTAFEFAYLNNKLDDFIALVKDFGLTMVEISDGTIEMSETQKLKEIEKFSKHFKVFSEFGSKDTDKLITPKKWVSGMLQELEAGAHTIIAEGRESGTAGIYRGNHEVRAGLVDEIVSEVPSDRILWEAPDKNHQAWFIKLLGANVNLGNIAPADALALETLRLGLRSDTLLYIHEKYYN